MPDLSHLSDEDLQALSQGDVSKASDAGLQTLAMHEEPKVGDSLAAKVPDSLKQLLGMFTAAQGGLVKGVTLGNLDPAKLPAMGGMYQQAGQEHPVAEMAGNVAGSILPTYAAGMAGKAVAPQTWGPVATSIAAKMQGGGIQGLAKAPAEGETRAGNMARGLALGAGAGAAGEAVAAGAKGLQAGGSGIANYLQSMKQAGNDPKIAAALLGSLLGGGHAAAGLVGTVAAIQNPTVQNMASGAAQGLANVAQNPMTAQAIQRAKGLMTQE